MGILNFLTGQEKKKVLLVEDDVPLRTFIAERLEANNIRVFQTGDGANALAQIIEQEPHCVVLDMMLPGKNGMQILAELRSVDADIPVVVLTTLSGEGGLQREAEKRNALFLNKADTDLGVVIDTILQQVNRP
jgi:CheY-like chemotaxis protein